VLALALAGSALAAGSVHTVVLCAATVALAVAASLAWWNAEPMHARPAATVLLLTGVALTVYTVLQCLPMPIGWLATIAPYNADVWSRCLSPLHEPGPTWAPLSLDPSATRVEVLKGVAYLMAFVTALLEARRREGAAFLGGCIMATGMALAVAALLHPAFNAHALFGIYTPVETSEARHIAPLLNPNNLAGYINLALCLALASTLSHEPQIPRPLAAATTVLLAATQVWVGSRGGTLAMGLGALVVAGLTYAARARPSRATPAVGVGAVGAMLAGAVLIVLGSSDQAASELLDTNVSKLHLFREVLRALPSVPFFGAGRGSFRSVFPAFHEGPGYITYTYPENVVLQWLIEWGAPLGIIGLLAVGYALRPRVALARSNTAAGAWAGLVAVAVQNLGDLGTEVPGLTLAAVVCAAVATAGTPGKATTLRVERWAQHPRRLAMLAAGSAALSVAVALAGLRHELRQDQEGLRVAINEGRLGMAPARATVREAMLRHPAEPYFPYAAAAVATKTGENPIPWIGATLDRARVYGPAHILLAQAVARRSPSQARLEYRLALEQAPEFTAYIVREATRVVRSYSDAQEIIPAGKAGAAVPELLVPLVRERLPATRALLDLDTLARSPTAYSPAVRLAEDALEDVETSAPWCAGSLREGCIQDALSKTSRLQLLRPTDCDGYALHARARLAGGDLTGAVQELQQASDLVTERVACLKQLATLARNDPQAYEAALRNIASAGCAGAECVDNLVWAGQSYELSGNPHKALGLYRRALRESRDDALLEHAAALAAALGLHAESSADYEELAKRHPEHLDWRRLSAREHDAAMRESQHL
jgi:tetratricopeptide (TPR) repeat protein